MAVFQLSHFHYIFCEYANIFLKTNPGTCNIIMEIFLLSKCKSLRKEVDEIHIRAGHRPTSQKPKKLNIFNFSFCFLWSNSCNIHIQN